MALGGAAAVFISQQASKAGVTPAVSRQTTTTREDQNKTTTPGSKEGEEADSSFGALFNRAPAQDPTVQERPERQGKLREQRVQTPKGEAKTAETTNRTTRTTEEGASPEGSAKLAKENKTIQLWGRDTRWLTQTKFDSNQASQNRLSDMGQRRMQAFYINRLVTDNFQQHTGGKADEPYSRAQYRQILGALSTVVGSSGAPAKSTRANDGSRSSEPNTAASLGRKMNDANMVQQIFEPPAPPPADYEPLELVA